MLWAAPWLVALTWFWAVVFTDLALLRIFALYIKSVVHIISVWFLEFSVFTSTMLPDLTQKQDFAWSYMNLLFVDDYTFCLENSPYYKCTTIFLFRLWDCDSKNTFSESNKLNLHYISTQNKMYLFVFAVLKLGIQRIERKIHNQ